MGDEALGEVRFPKTSLRCSLALDPPAARAARRRRAMAICDRGPNIKLPESA